MRKMASAVIFLLGLSILTACGVDGSISQSDMSAYEKIQEAIVSLESYETDAEVEYISNKGSNLYSTKQKGKMSGEYRIEVIGPERVAGNITVSDTMVVAQYNPRIAGRVSVSTAETMDRTEILVTSFIKNYLKSQEVSISAANMDESRCTVLEAQIPGDHAYLATEKLWVDNDTLKPVQLIIYDPEGGERVIVKYQNFEYNVELDDSIFKVE